MLELVWRNEDGDSPGRRVLQGCAARGLAPLLYGAPSQLQGRMTPRAGPPHCQQSEGLLGIPAWIPIKSRYGLSDTGLFRRQRTAGSFRLLGTKQQHAPSCTPLRGCSAPVWRQSALPRLFVCGWILQTCLLLLHLRQTPHFIQLPLMILINIPARGSRGCERETSSLLLPQH